MHGWLFWTPGDPTIYGWLATVGYAATAVACWLAYARSPRRDRGFWLLLGVFVALLGINKQLDLQTALRAIGRAHAQANGWYDRRHKLQIEFIAGFSIMFVAGFALILRRVRRASGAVKWASGGLALLMLFVIVRASEIGHFLIDRPIVGGGMRAVHALEAAGIVLVAVSAIASLKRARRPLTISARARRKA